MSVCRCSADGRSGHLLWQRWCVQSRQRTRRSVTGADELVTMWTVYRDMLAHPLTEQWNKIFMDEWVDMHKNGLLEGVPVALD